MTAPQEPLQQLIAEQRKTRRLIVWLVCIAAGIAAFVLIVNTVEDARRQEADARDARMKAYFKTEEAMQALQRR